MTLVSGASSRMFSSVRKPSVTLPGFRRQAEVERHHGRLEAAHLRDRFFPVGRDRDVPGVERPLHLRLQRGVVLDDQQRAAGVGAHAAAPDRRRVARCDGATQVDADLRALARRALHFDATSDLLNVLLALEGTDPHAGVLRRLERLEEALAHELRRHPLARSVTSTSTSSPAALDANLHGLLSLGGVEPVLHEVRDHALEQVVVRPREDAGVGLDGQAGPPAEPQRLHATGDRPDVDRLRPLARRGLRPQLQRQLVHAADDMLDGLHHVALEVGIVAVPLGVRKQELELRNQVFQVMHDERGHAVEGVELLGLQQGFGGLGVGEVAGGLAARGLQQVEHLPVEVDLDARRAEHDEADEFLRRSAAARSARRRGRSRARPAAPGPRTSPAACCTSLMSRIQPVFCRKRGSGSSSARASANGRETRTARPADSRRRPCETTGRRPGSRPGSRWPGCRPTRAAPQPRT